MLAYETVALLGEATPDYERAADLLREAESWLIGHKLRDLEVLVRDLRERIDLAAPSAPLASESPAAGSGLGGRATVDIVARSRPMQRVLDLARRLAASPFLPVLVSGETGTGKELVARAIHEESPRHSAPFVTIGCATLSEPLLEAELFGFCRGAFSGADRDREGLLVAARGGTILFDEVAGLSLALQAKLLRLLDGAPVRPVGADEEVDVDVRYLFSTNQNLRSLVETGRLREDLLFRLAGLEIVVPPLRERQEDIPALVARFQALGGSEQRAAFDGGAMQVLASYEWPGNVRELQNVMSRLVLTGCGRIGADYVRQALDRKVSPRLFSPTLLRSRTLRALRDELEREYFLELHADSRGDLEAMARALGTGKRALYKRLRRLGIRPGELE